jgi:hypothetical protein
MNNNIDFSNHYVEEQIENNDSQLELKTSGITQSVWYDEIPQPIKFEEDRQVFHLNLYHTSINK